MSASQQVTVASVISRARGEGRDVLLEHEGYALLRAMGVAVPAHFFVRDAGEAASVDLSHLGGGRVVVKVVSSRILHRSDEQGIEVVPASDEAVRSALERLEKRFAGRDVDGYVVSAFVEHDATFGGELLVGMRWTPDFGPVVTLGPGGIHAELLAKRLGQDRATAVLSPELTPPDRIPAILGQKAIVEAATGTLRGGEPRIAPERLQELLATFTRFAERHVPGDIVEFEVNPLVATPEGPVALDAVVRLSDGTPPSPAPDRPLDRLDRLLRPRSIAVMGVSEKLNPGHVIVNNILAEGFGRDRVALVKKGVDRIEGCRCYPDIASLPEPVDLMILSVAASQVPGIVEEVVALRKAESLIVIPGGLGERSGTGDLEGAVRATLAGCRNDDGSGPLVNGGNCLGIRSVPGRYNTLFIPEHKLRIPEGPETPLAIVSQSGAFVVSKASNLQELNPRYLISLGNQIDLTVGDYLVRLGDDPDVRVFACYVEGFRDLDGQRWLEAASEIVSGGRDVILYRAGRSPAGASASASHTASIAGDYVVARELAAGAGVMVADTLADFEDLIRLCCFLDGKVVRGLRLGAVSNAGYECVAVGDNLGPFRLAPFEESTKKRLGALLEGSRLEGVVEARNPLDVTPIMGDEGFEEAVRAVLEDDSVDIGVVGCVPLTAALKTLPEVEGQREGIHDEDSVGSRLVRLAAGATKPWVAVVDAGPLYDPLASMLTASGAPTFRSIDRALRLLAVYCRSRVGRARG